MSAALGFDPELLTTLQSQGLYLTFEEIRAFNLNTLEHLSASELAQFHALKLEKRRRDWIAGRLAAKEAIRVLLESTGRPIPSLHELQINRSASGAPSTTLEGIDVSISHSGLWACALASERERSGAVGVDLEERKPIDVDMMPVAFTKQECNWIAKDNSHYYQFWTAKEAALKALKVGLTVDLQTIEVVPESNTQSVVTFDNESFRVQTYYSENHVLSITAKSF